MFIYLPNSLWSKRILSRSTPFLGQKFAKIAFCATFCIPLTSITTRVVDEFFQQAKPRNRLETNSWNLENGPRKTRKHLRKCGSPGKSPEGCDQFSFHANMSITFMFGWRNEKSFNARVKPKNFKKLQGRIDSFVAVILHCALKWSCVQSHRISRQLNASLQHPILHGLFFDTSRHENAAWIVL